MRQRLLHLAAITLMVCALAGPLSALAQQRACQMMKMHHDGRTPCWCGDMAGIGAIATPPALPAVALAPLRPTAPQPAPTVGFRPQPPDSPVFPPTPPPPNERLS